ncbi:MAG: DUF4112 domain-containing protein [Myxococcota bacterium]|nr:DUF4112 domain-containing protein [Myxococcota bacterium]
MGQAGDFRTPGGGIPVYSPPRAKRGSGIRVDGEVARVRRLATVLDRYMIDPVIGLILPGAGDVLGSLLGLYTVSIAIRRRMSPVIIARMLMNLGVDALLGIVPLLGDLVDVGFKANTRNAALLEQRQEQGGKATARDWLMVIGSALVFMAAIGLSIYAVIALVRAIF